MVAHLVNNVSHSLGVRRKSLANLIQHFVRLDGKAKDPLNTRTLFFPRYHQMDVVREIIDHAGKKGVGQTYLIQHSAGSGKSNSITWAAFQLIETYPQVEGIHGSKGMEKPLFDSVIVVTDRRLLDKQIRDNIKDFSEVKNIVAPAYSSRELRESLERYDIVAKATSDLITDYNIENDYNEIYIIPFYFLCLLIFLLKKQ